jgi:hypothetical protein
MDGGMRKFLDSLAERPKCGATIIPAAGSYYQDWHFKQIWLNYEERKRKKARRARERILFGSSINAEK